MVYERQSRIRNDAEFQGNNGHGDVYVLRFSLATERAAAAVLSAWIIRDGEDFPRLITCSVLRPMSDPIKIHDVVALTQDVRTKTL